MYLSDSQTGTRLKSETVAPLCVSAPIIRIGSPRDINHCPLLKLVRDGKAFLGRAQVRKPACG